MMCYKDMTFCTARCSTVGCRRMLTKEVLQGAKAWWGSDEAPIAFRDYSDECGDYKEQGEDV